jgi:DNA-binding NtrC family response regulator
LGSLRGTRVSGQSVFQHILREGDVIEIADYELIYSVHEPGLQDLSPLRVVSRSPEGAGLDQNTAYLTNREFQREINFTEAQKEVVDSLLQATHRRMVGKNLLVQMLPAIARTSGAVRGFVTTFRSGDAGAFDVLGRMGMSPRDQIEITDAGFVQTLLGGLPVLEERVLLSPIFDHDVVTGFFAIERPEFADPFTPEETAFAVLLGRLAASRVHGSTWRGRSAGDSTVWEWPAAMIGRSVPIQALCQQIKEAAGSEANVLVEGESGVGKELVARAIHEAGRYAPGPFLARNCAAITESLAEAEIFGHAARSGIAGADPEGAPGWFEQALNGTLFLDEIHGLNLALQDKFLRVLQEKEVWRVRGRRAIPVKAQVIAASDHNLEEATQDGTFRAPLFFRFGKRIKVPPLRERVEDIVLLAYYFLDRYAQRLESPARTLSHRALQLLQRYHWPGNVRELENSIRSAVAKVRDREIVFSWDLPEMALEMHPSHVEGKAVPENEGGRELSLGASKSSRPRPMVAIEKEKIMESLESTHGNISLAAKLLGYRSRQTILNKMDRFGIPRNYGDTETV